MNCALMLCLLVADRIISPHFGSPRNLYKGGLLTHLIDCYWTMMALVGLRGCTFPTVVGEQPKGLRRVGYSKCGTWRLKTAASDVAAEVSAIRSDPARLHLRKPHHPNTFSISRRNRTASLFMSIATSSQVTCLPTPISRSSFTLCASPIGNPPSRFDTAAGINLPYTV